MTLTKRWRYTPAAIQEHTGLAADTKPTSNVPYQSTFLETDTGKQYVYDGTAWVQVAGTIVVDGVKETAETQETGSVGAIGWLSSIKGFLRKLYATMGITSGAKIITDAAGTVQQYLRGLVSLAVSGITVVQPTAASLNATVTPVSWSFSVEMGVGTNVVKASAGQLHGVLIETDGTNDVTVQLFNHASTATNPMTPAIVVPGTDRYGGIIGIDCAFTNGCVIVLSGTGGVATVYHR